MTLFHSRRKRHLASFTLVELLVVIAIIGLLVSLSQPALAMALKKAQSIKCSVNLRSIGTAVSLAATDNNNTYPEINQTAPPLPYGSDVQGIVGVLGPYGITANSVECPSDILMGKGSSFTQYGSSYEWMPAFDDEAVNATVIYINPGTAIPVNSSRVRLCTDFNGLHRGHPNALYGDGHVRAY
jgi:prepilin-type N-terminal cleavage/methylation domain-containing protein/prepilin-type processing-associated H-X9-DG protein